MDATASRREASLRSRVAIGSALLVALPVVVALLVLLASGSRLGNRATGDALSRSGFVQDHFRQQRAQQLALISRVFASDPAFSSYLAEATGAGLGSAGGVDSRSITDLLAERQADLGFDFAIALDPAGRILARTDRPGTPGESLSDDPLVAQVMRELRPATGVWSSGGRLYQAAALPLARGGDLTGFLVTTLAVDDGLASQMARVGGSDVVFLGRTAPGEPSVLGSSLDLRRAEGLRRWLESHPDPLSAALERGTQLPQFELTVEGEQLVGRLDPLADSAGQPLGAVITLTSLALHAQALRTIQRAVLVTGVLSMAIAVLLSVVFVRRTLSSVRRLAEAADAASRGDYGHDLEPPATHELARMARAFNRLLEDLRERRAMSDYLSEIARHLPDSQLASVEELSAVPAQAPTAGVDDTVEAPRGSELPTVADPPGSPRRGQTTPRLSPGTAIGSRYRVLALLGAGGMGEVYKAIDDELGDVVALKRLNARIGTGTTQLELLKSEIRLARKITHPNVLRTFDYAEHDGVAYISMEYVRGMTLRYLMDQTGRLPDAAALFVARQLAEGLDAAHAVGVLHRDIKPANLIVNQHGHAKLMDFGLAVRLAPRGPIAGRWIGGTPGYTAPEVFRGEEPDARSDVFSVGAVMYEMFTGRRAFDDAAVLGAFDSPEWTLPSPPPPSSYRPDIDPALARIISACLDPDPAGRPRTAAELRDALAGIRGRPPA